MVLLLLKSCQEVFQKSRNLQLICPILLIKCQRIKSLIWKIRKKILDNKLDRTRDERLDELLQHLIATVRVNGHTFGWFIDVLKDYDTIFARKIADNIENGQFYLLLVHWLYVKWCIIDWA